MLTQHTLDRLRQLGLSGMAEALRTQRESADIQQLSFEAHLHGGRGRPSSRWPKGPRVRNALADATTKVEPAPPRATACDAGRRAGRDAVASRTRPTA